VAGLLALRGEGRQDPLIELRSSSPSGSGATIHLAVSALIALAGFLFLNQMYCRRARYSAAKAGC